MRGTRATSVLAVAAVLPAVGVGQAPAAGTTTAAATASVGDAPGGAAALARLGLVLHAAARMHISVPTSTRLYGTAVVVVPRDATLGEVATAVPQAIGRSAGGRTLTLRRTLVVTHGARLTIAAPAVRTLRLASGPRGAATLTAWGGDLRFVGTAHRPLTVVSAVPGSGRPDTQLADGRASVSALAGGRLDARHVRFRSLGFFPGILSGVAVASGYGQQRGGGDLVASEFRDNYFGAYTYNALGMRWLRDRFVDNAVYGFDPHDNSDRFLVRDNYAARNGRHGIIFSRFCDNNVILGNVSEHNGWHGIVLDDGKAADGPSRDNVVAGNVVRDNRLVGISLDGSGPNLVSGNRVSGGEIGIRVYGPSAGDVVTGNAVARARTFGIVVLAPARETTVRGNRVADLPTGVRVQSAARSTVADNRLAAMRDHGIFLDVAGRGVRETIRGNAISGAGGSPLRIVDGDDGDDVSVEAGPTHWRYPALHRIERILSWVVGPGLWLALLAMAVGGGAIVRVLDRVRGGAVRA